MYWFNRSLFNRGYRIYWYLNCCVNTDGGFKCRSNQGKVLPGVIPGVSSIPTDQQSVNPPPPPPLVKWLPSINKVTDYTTDLTAAYRGNWDASGGRATLGDSASRPILMRQERIYSLFHIVQITDFLDFLNEYCKEKSETFTKF